MNQGIREITRRALRIAFNLNSAVAGLKMAHLLEITSAFEFTVLTLTVPGLRLRKYQNPSCFRVSAPFSSSLTAESRFKLGIVVWVVVSFLLCSAAQAYAEPEEPYDPAESVNRFIFDVNDTLDIHVMEPIAKAYKNNIPDPIQTGIKNFFLNLRYPSYLVSDIIQGKFEQALDHTGRFLINSTIGVLGFVDMAKDYGLPDHEEDFGIALMYHGVPAGPYIVLPFLGPSNVRDGVGRIVDGFLDPIGWVGYSSLSSGTKVAIAATALGVKAVHTRAGLLQAIEAGKESAVDYYLFAQGAYYQYRQGLLTDGMDDEEDTLGESEPKVEAIETRSEQ